MADEPQNIFDEQGRLIGHTEPMYGAGGYAPPRKTAVGRTLHSVGEGIWGVAFIITVLGFAAVGIGAAGLVFWFVGAVFLHWTVDPSVYFVVTAAVALVGFGLWKLYDRYA